MRDLRSLNRLQQPSANTTRLRKSFHDNKIQKQLPPVEPNCSYLVECHIGAEAPPDAATQANPSPTDRVSMDSPIGRAAFCGARRSQGKPAEVRPIQVADC